MFKIAIIIFRECLEIALLLGIILASTRHIKDSKLYVITGAMTGVVLASIFAFFIRTITVAYGTHGDELFDSCSTNFYSERGGRALRWGQTPKLCLRLR